MITYKTKQGLGKRVHAVSPTIFPDKTSQVWHLPEWVVDNIKNEKIIHIEWDFDEEVEVMHLLQLLTLVRHHNENAEVHLEMPYMPYARQDKEISNDATFALHTFLGLLVLAVDRVIVFDPHSEDLLKYYFGANYTAVKPTFAIQKALDTSNTEVICWPDAGASKRYGGFEHYRSVQMNKIRDQSTGEITGMRMDGGVEDCRVMIIDDLCDGGRTFCEAAKILYARGARDVNLYVSHGIFSHPEGVGILHKNGISRVYVKDGIFSSSGCLEG